MRARTLAALVAGAALAHVGPAATWLPPVRLRLTPRLAGLGAPGHLALTFDDGPDPAGTPAVLAVLAELRWTATFFMLGEQARAWPQVAAQVVAAGHEVGLHGDTHRYLIARTPRATYADLAAGLAAVTAATGVRPRLFRPPYGVLSAAGLVAAGRLGLTPVLWSSWGRDWRAQASAGSVVRDLGRGVLSGGTALLHDSDVTSAPGSWRTTVEALGLLAAEVSARGLTVGPLREHGRYRGRATG